MEILKTKVKDMKKSKKLMLVLLASSLLATLTTKALANTPLEPIPVLELVISDNARIVDSDDGIYVVGTSDGDLYVINEEGEYTETSLGAGSINDVRIENGFIAVAAYVTVIELELNGLTPTELWRTTSSEWYHVVSTDLSENGDYVCYMAQRNSYYEDGGEIGVLQGGSGGGGLISKVYTSGYRYTNWWVDATGDMEYIAASHPTYPPYYQVGIGLYKFDGSALTLEWWRLGVTNYETTEVRISEDKNYVAAATSSGTYMKLLRISDGELMWSHNTPGQEQFACDGDDNLNYVIGANQAWSPPYGWFIIRNLGSSGYGIIAQGTMQGPINDLDSDAYASMLAFGSDTGEFLLLKRSGNTVETIFDEDIGKFIDAIEVGETSLLVGGSCFINLYTWNRPPDCTYAYADPGCLWSPNNKLVAVDILGVTDPDGDPVTITITGITSDEPTASDEGAGGAKHAPDAAGVGEDMAQVRAERSGLGNGRVYEISFTASDGMGGECEGSVTVCVPHDQGGEDCECIDDGQIYDATQIN